MDVDGFRMVGVNPAHASLAHLLFSIFVVVKSIQIFGFMGSWQCRTNGLEVISDPKPKTFSQRELQNLDWLLFLSTIADNSQVVGSNPAWDHGECAPGM